MKISTKIRSRWFFAQVSSPSSRRGRPPLAPTGRIGSTNGEKRPERVPPHSSGSRKELLTKDKLKQKAQKKGRLPKLSSLVKRMRSFIGSRNTKSEGESSISTVRAIKSERTLSRPERMLRSSKSGPGPRVWQSAKHLRRDTLGADYEDPQDEEARPLPPAPATPMDRQLSIEAIPVQDPKVEHNHCMTQSIFFCSCSDGPAALPLLFRPCMYIPERIEDCSGLLVCHVLSSSCC